VLSSSLDFFECCSSFVIETTSFFRFKGFVELL
jgi:hypothetical protein